MFDKNYLINFYLPPQPVQIETKTNVIYNSRSNPPHPAKEPFLSAK